MYTYTIKQYSDNRKSNDRFVLLLLLLLFSYKTSNRQTSTKSTKILPQSFSHTQTHTHTHVCTVSVTANFSQRQTRRIRSTEPRLKAVKTASANVFTSFSSRCKLEIRRLITWPLMATMSDPSAVCYKSNWVAAVNKGKIPAIKILRRR